MVVTHCSCTINGRFLIKLYKHYAFDAGRQWEHPRNRFARYSYTDASVAYCQSDSKANAPLAAIERRLKEYKLEMHSANPGFLYSKDDDGRKEIPTISMDVSWMQKKVLIRYHRRAIAAGGRISGQ